MVKYLTDAGYVVDTAADGEEAEDRAGANSYDAIVLDLGLPLKSGISLLGTWRRAGLMTPVLIVTARSGWVERVAGLNAGADDYLEKPFQPPELIARIRALLRRAAGSGSSTLRQGEVELDSTTGVVRKEGREITLTAREMRILDYLMHRPERIVSQSELLDHIYTGDEARDPNTIEVYISRLRKKLGPDFIRTVRGLGYKLG